MIALPAPAFAAETLVVGVHDNLVPKSQRKRAVVALQGMVDLLGERVGVSMTVQILPSGTARDLESTARALNSGAVHIVGMSVLEYNWLPKIEGQLDVLSIADPGVRDVRQYEQVVVRADRIRELSQLRGGTLAAYEKPLPSALIYLDRLRRKWGPDFLSRELPPAATAADAMDAVFHGEADAVIVDLLDSRDYEQAYPGMAKKLNTIDRSDHYPVVPIIGNPREVDKLRKGLWGNVKVELAQIHTRRRAEAFFEHWRAKRFSAPDDNYLKQVAESAKVFPLRDLPIGLPR